MSETKLKNGLTIVTTPFDSEFVTIAFYVNKGARDEKDDELGIAHLVEHMVFKGTINRDRKQIWADIQKNGGILNACTTEDYTMFFVHCLKEYMDEALDVIYELVFLNTIPEEEFELEKSVVVEEVKMYENQIEQQALVLLNKTLYPNNKNRWDVGSTPENVSKITRKQVIDFINRNYIPQNITLYVAGDVEQKHFVDKMEDYLRDFEFIKSSPEIRAKNIKLNFDDAKESKDGSQSAMIAYYPMNLKNNKEVVMDEISNYILGDGFNSRFMTIREDFGYVYSLECDTDFDGFDEEGYSLVFTQLNSQNIPKTKEVIEGILDEYCKDGVSDEEFECAVNNIKFKIRKSFETVNKTNETIIGNRQKGIPETEKELMKLLNSITKADFDKFIKDKFKDVKVNYIIVEQTR